jgi:hypothetical protein
MIFFICYFLKKKAGALSFINKGEIYYSLEVTKELTTGTNPVEEGTKAKQGTSTLRTPTT